MSAEANKATVRYFLTSGNAPYDLTVIDAICGADFGTGIKDFLQMELAAFPDKRSTFDDLVAEGDKVVLRYTVEGTHQGAFRTPLGTLPATGKAVKTSVISIYRLADGKIVDETASVDWLDVLQQLGAEVNLP